MIRIASLSLISALAIATPVFAQDKGVNTPPTDLTDLTQWLESHSGVRLTSIEGTDFVYANPPGDLWQLDAQDGVARTARISATDGKLFAHWDDGEVQTHYANEPLPVVATDQTYPLAAFYAALVAQPLTKSIGPLPAGTQFATNGTLRLGPDGTQQAQWLALAEHIKVLGYDFEPVTFHWSDLSQAMVSSTTANETEVSSE
jgi:hypothetical protein